MKTKHTPGSWVAFREETGDYSIESDYGTVAEVTAENCDDCDQVAADATLLAAAPDMLEALESAVTKLREFIPREARGYQHGCFKYVTAGDMFDCPCAICQSRRAIAKAKGEG
jgi:hypothetical protein